MSEIDEFLITKKDIEWMMELPKNVDRATLRKLKDDRISSIVINHDIGLDFILEVCLKMTFRQDNYSEIKKLFDPYSGILVSLIQKARIAYALGLIDKTTFKDITYLHKIRNFFAHRHRVKFTNPDMRKLCMKLSTAAKIKKFSSNKGLEFFVTAQSKCVKCIFDSMENVRQLMMLAKPGQSILSVLL